MRRRRVVDISGIRLVIPRTISCQVRGLLSLLPAVFILIFHLPEIKQYARLKTQTFNTRNSAATSTVDYNSNLILMQKIRAENMGNSIKSGKNRSVPFVHLFSKLVKIFARTHKIFSLCNIKKIVHIPISGIEHSHLSGAFFSGASLAKYHSWCQFGASQL